MPAPAVSTPDEHDPSEEIKEILKSPGPDGRKEKIDVDAVRSKLDSRYWDTYNALQQSHADWRTNRLKNLAKLRTPKRAYKRWIKTEAAERAEDKMDDMGDLANSGRERLSFFSLKTANRLSKLTAQIEVSDEVLKMLDAMKINFKDIYKNYQGMAAAFKREHPVRSSIEGWFGMSDVGHLTNPFSAVEDRKIREAAREVKTKARAKKQSYLAESRQKFRNPREIDKRIRDTLLQYKPALSDEIDALMTANSKGEDALMNKIDEIIAGASPGKEQEREFLKKMAGELQSKKGRRSELFYRLENEQVIGKGNEVLPMMSKLRLGTPVEMHWKGRDTEDDYQCRVWGTGRDGRVILRRVASDEQFVLDSKSNKAWRDKDKKARKPNVRYEWAKLENLQFLAAPTPAT